MGLGALGGTELLRLLDKHAEEVSRSHQLHRAKGSREELPCRVKGQRPLGSLVSTRGNSMKMRSTESRERESRGSKTLWKQFCQGKIHHFFNLIWRFCDNNPNCIHQVFMYLVSAILYEESAQKIICNHSWQIIICRIDYFYQPVNLLRHSFFYNVPYCSCISRGLVKQMNKDDATLPEVDFKANPTEKAPMALR